MIYKIRISNWTKYNPRKDVASASWYKLDHNYNEKLAMSGLTWAESALWPALLGARSKRNSEVFEINLSWYTKTFGIRKDTFKSAINKFKEMGMVEFDVVTSRGRHADVTLEREREREEREKRERELRADSDASKPRAKKRVATKSISNPSKKKTDGGKVWDEYALAYQNRYGSKPVSNAKNYRHCSDLVNRLGLELACKVVVYYLSHTKSWYLENTHQLAYCLKDCESLATQLDTGITVTRAKATQLDKQHSNFEAFKQVAAKLERKYSNEQQS